MIDSEELHRKVSQETLESLLRIRGEGDNLDFKQIFSLSSQQARAELIRDILAFANTIGGGHIVYGVDKAYIPVGLPPIESLQQIDRLIDTTEIYKAMERYVAANLQFMAAEYEIQWSDWPEKRRFGILYVAKFPGIALAQRDISYYDGKKDIKLVKSADILVRRGAQSCHADQATLNSLIKGIDTFFENKEDQVPPLDNNLPPREEVTIEFIGRREELVALQNWFNDPARKRWLLAGYGGKGKTVIAYEFATQIQTKAPDGFAYVLWLSSKERKFREGVIQSIESPDFWDLPSLLDAILRGYGFTEYISLPFNEKRERVFELLTTLPALLVADDIDSLENENEGAIEFLISDIASTPSKVLLTSRRVPFGFNHIKTEVSGLNKEDREQFIRSRIRLFGLDRDSTTTRFSPRRIEEILQVTENSPLYIEDLLRLCVSIPVDEAIADWKKNGGDKAREYALKREFDLLTPSAKETVFACCLPTSSVSLSEIQLTTGKSRSQIKSELAAIQNLFLISRPKLIDGEERYDVNANMRRLILHTYRESDIFKRLKSKYDGQFGQLNTGQKNEVASYIRNAVAIQRLGEDKEAEKLLQSALELYYPNNPDLTAELGVVYYYWRPRRIADARKQFEFAKQLGCKRERMYRIWAIMENKEEEWTTGIAVAEAGINVGNEVKELYYLAGYAHSRQGQYLKRSFHSGLAEQELIAADKMLRKALKDPEDLADYSEWKLNSKIFRALVINCAELARIDDMHSFIERWQHEHPKDEHAMSQGEQLKAMYPRLTRK